ncbi:circularly permuted type 2 ATP-grasp protein [Thiomicrospira microaerophila]|nr:circularly permuted type 2 ATP-grasp protein [Thiomicrospira microaerophila]UQB43506.1 circularly permuted type 2 ATP-grasp protein [Thiomicrospira microaerophila]
MLVQDYTSPGCFDESLVEGGGARACSKALVDYVSPMDIKQLQDLQKLADATIARMGVSFTVYSDEGNIDRAWPFDIWPRVIDANEWRQVEKGLAQRLKALNCFIDDVYNERAIFKAGVVPDEVVFSSRNFRPECVGMKPKHQAWANICGTDLVRDASGAFFVLEDNLRVPSGVSYMLENRGVMKQVVPELFENLHIQPMGDYPNRLLSMLSSMSPNESGVPEVVVLTPGIYNSAYYEHAFLAHEMGAELVEGSDLLVGDDDYVYMRNIEGLKRVDVIYRRIDDEFIDPEVFCKDSTLGVPGLMRAWRAGKVAIANAPGCGVADDKVVYAYVPDMIRFYLNEEPLVKNVPTYLCSREDQRAYVLENIEKLVVKPANESGGYGMLVGPHASVQEHQAFRQLIAENPRNYIAQPTLSLSTVPTLCAEAIEPRHVDLRPFILQGANSYVTPGGLTRVAMVKGSLVVNSSQGGGSKDTWIVDLEVDDVI